MRIVFFGTPDFAVPSLDALLARGDEVAAIVTQPDRPRGRSRSTLEPTPVKRRALDVGLPVLAPERPSGGDFLAELRALRADLGVVVAYGHILRPPVLAVPRHGMINVHASLLPRLRGAAPIQWAILEGDTETGITIMQMDEGLDTGPMLHQIAMRIGEDETAGGLAARLSLLGARALTEALARIDAGTAHPEPQQHDLASYAPKIDRAVTRLVWTEPAVRCARRMRAFDPVPGAWTMIDGQELKCFSPEVVPTAGPAGTVLEAGNRLVVAAADGAVAIGEVQPAGRGRMPALAWLRGRRVPEGVSLG
jgi:methionyl-tRNA formyltransferase